MAKKIERVMIIAPGATYSTYDIFRNYNAGMKQNGMATSLFNLHNHALYHLAGIEMYHAQDYRTEQERLMVAFARSAREILLDVLIDRPDAIIFISLFNVPHDILRHLLRMRSENNLRFVMAGIFTECPYLDQITDRYFDSLDYIYLNDRNSVDKFTLIYPNKNIKYLSHKYDPSIHRIRPAMDEYKSDVFFVGTPFPERIDMFKAVDWSGIDLKIIGPHWGNFTDGTGLDQYISDGFVDNNVVSLFYNGTKIAVNIHRVTKEFGFTPEEFDKINEDEESYSAGPRVFESVACGTFVLTTPRKEVQDMFGDAMATFRTPEEFGDKVHYYLEHEVERLDMARRCNEILVSAGYTYAKSSADILIDLNKFLGET